MLRRRQVKQTLTPVELDIWDTLELERTDGSLFRMQLIDTGAELVCTTLADFRRPEEGAKTVYRFYCEVEIGGRSYRLEREVPTWRSFYEPFEIDGMLIWPDAVSAIFKADGGFLEQKDVEIGIPCLPRRHARFALQQADLEICPERLHPWLDLPGGVLDIASCYRGEDCWMGPYDGLLAHGGLDINHPKGQPLYAPFDLDDQYYFHSVRQSSNEDCRFF